MQDDEAIAELERQVEKFERKIEESTSDREADAFERPLAFATAKLVARLREPPEDGSCAVACMRRIEADELERGQAEAKERRSAMRTAAGAERWRKLTQFQGRLLAQIT
jgi:hypothetical protein